ncbi:Hypothetical protein R9X50_00425500 [Acrodontium crateriforme]|uniref:Small ribosomal subunit protein mS35 mitochondrial conserved domain-containing protein n=1 Tax=Acrodontium crateriforme TaxID=150365 RepID=A0AAQ3RAL3_9PEZI|nr:Hypothetical protein R9X50_00425500 [Acrodontium crateriforme]
MSAPIKRVCQQAVRQRPLASRSRTATDLPQWRPFSIAAVRNAAPAQDPSPHVHQFPESSKDSNADPDFDTSELSSIAHAELAQHQELRTLLRTAAWEMPLLSNLAQPYKPHDRASQPLRWRYTTYMGEEHPAARKVVVEFRPNDLKLTEAQTTKLLKLVGPRYNPDKELVKMSCENFETPAMNKRHLADTIKELIAEAKNSKTDSFAEIPLDLRHHKSKPKLRFPEEWLLTEERKQELEESRKQKLLEESERVKADQIVSGLASIDESRRLAVKKAAEQPAVVQQAKQSLPLSKGGRRDVRGSGRK